jgi:hypothetical protein
LPFLKIILYQFNIVFYKSHHLPDHILLPQ